MIWLILGIAFMGLALVGGYFLAARSLGHDVANRNVRDALPWLLVGFAIAFAAPLLVPFTGNIVPIIYIVAVLAWLVSWPYRRRAAGSLLLDAGRPARTKFLVWIGLLEGAIAIYFTVTSLMAIAPPEDGITRTLGVMFWWTITAFFLATGLSRLEFRENGVCFLYTFIPWPRMTSYQWGTVNPNTLTLRYNSLLPLLPGFMSITVPARHRDVSDRIVSTHIPYRGMATDQ